MVSPRSYRSWARLQHSSRKVMRCTTTVAYMLFLGIFGSFFLIQVLRFHMHTRLSQPEKYTPAYPEPNRLVNSEGSIEKIVKVQIFPQGGGNIKWDQPWSIPNHFVYEASSTFVNSSDSSQKYLVSNFTFSPGLGNMMFQYASLRALAERNNASLIVPASTLLRRAFDITPTLVSDTVEEELIAELHNTYTDVKRYYPECCRYYPEAETVFDDGRSLQLFMGYFQSFKYFHPSQEALIRREFKLLPVINERAHQFLLKARVKMVGKYENSNLTYVGMHVRRGIDMTWNLRNIEHGHKVATKRYLTRAMDFYREKYKNVVFLLCSDDLKWCKDNIEQEAKDVMVIDSGFREVDLAVMAMSNHTIMTIGTFSWWAAYLAGGDVIYYKEWPRQGSKLAEMLRKEDYFLPNWIGMD